MADGQQKDEISVLNPKKNSKIWVPNTLRKQVEEMSKSMKIPQVKAVSIFNTTMPVILGHEIINSKKTKKKRLRLYGVWEMEL